MIERRTFFGQTLAFIAGLRIFGSKVTAAEAAPIKIKESTPVSVGSASFVEFVKQHLPKDFFNEWAKQLEADPSDATTFTNAFMEMLRGPENHNERKACAVFSNFMKSRSWPEIQEILKDSLDEKTKAIFQKPESVQFYEQFKAMVLEQIRDYWEQFLELRRNKNGDSDGSKVSN